MSRAKAAYLTLSIFRRAHLPRKRPIKSLRGWKGKVSVSARLLVKKTVKILEAERP